MKNMKTQTDCCETGFLERPRYFARQLLTPAEMTLEQTYFRDKSRRHNRLMHGWGVVCGAIVCVVPRSDGGGPEPWLVKVSPGYALDPCGNEIVIDRERVIDLRTPGATGCAGENPVEQIDPWCSQVWIDRQGGTVFVAVKYKEIICRPVRVQPNGCGCGDSECEYSRVRDGYEYGVLDECPDEDAEPPSLEDLSDGKNPVCLECQDGPWVVLAEVQMDADGSIMSIDNCRCRRIAMSFSGYWRGCENGMLRIDLPQPREVRQGEKDLTMDIPAPGVHPDAEVNFGLGITVKSRESTSTVPLRVTFDVDEKAPLGMHTLTVINPDDMVGIKRDAIKVLPKPRPVAGGPGGGTRPTADVPPAEPAKKRTPRKGAAKDNP